MLCWLPYFLLDVFWETYIIISPLFHNANFTLDNYFAVPILNSIWTLQNPWRQRKKIYKINILIRTLRKYLKLVRQWLFGISYFLYFWIHNFCSLKSTRDFEIEKLPILVNIDCFIYFNILSLILLDYYYILVILTVYLLWIKKWTTRASWNVLIVSELQLLLICGWFEANTVVQHKIFVTHIARKTVHCIKNIRAY